MTYIFLKDELEAILLFVTAPVYLTIIGLLQSKNIKLLNSLKRNRENIVVVNLLKAKHKKIKYFTPIFMLIGLTVHIVLYVIFNNENLRMAYFISIGIMYCIYTLIGLINFYLKGAGILKDIGGFNGLPGN